MTCGVGDKSWSFDPIKKIEDVYGLGEKIRVYIKHCLSRESVETVSKVVFRYKVSQTARRTRDVNNPLTASRGTQRELVGSDLLSSLGGGGGSEQ